MHDGFGLVNPVSAPLLERVVRDERLGRDNPRRKPDERPKSEGMAARRDAEPQPGAADNESDASKNHIDLRI